MSDHNNNKFFDTLSIDDQALFTALRDRLILKSKHHKKNRINKVLPMFKEIRNFIEHSENDVAQRCQACGICWLNDGVAINNSQFSIFLNRCKSSLNELFSAADFKSKPFNKDTKAELLSKIPCTGTEIKRWTIRFHDPTFAPDIKCESVYNSSADEHMQDIGNICGGSNTSQINEQCFLADSSFSSPAESSMICGESVIKHTVSFNDCQMKTETNESTIKGSKKSKKMKKSCSGVRRAVMLSEKVSYPFITPIQSQSPPYFDHSLNGNSDFISPMSHISEEKLLKVKQNCIQNCFPQNIPPVAFMQQQIQQNLIEKSPESRLEDLIIDERYTDLSKSEYYFFTEELFFEINDFGDSSHSCNPQNQVNSIQNIKYNNVSSNGADPEEITLFDYSDENMFTFC